MLIRRCIKLLISTIVLSLLCTQVQSDKRGRYRFNHPPSIESEDMSVPVALALNKGVTRENKAIKLYTDSENPTKNHETTVKEIQNLDKDSVKSLMPGVVLQEKEKNIVRGQNPFSRKLNTRTNSQITVIAVDEAETSTPLSTTEIEQSTSKRKRKLIRSRQQKPKENVNSPVAAVNSATNINDGMSREQIKEISMSDNSQSPKDNPSNVPINVKTETTSKSRKRMRNPVVPIVNEQNFVFAHSGNFHYSFEGGDGTKVFEEGSLKSVNKDKAGEAVFGGFSYKDKEGKDYSLTYTADENGYRPIGEHLPTPPPIPPEIARALKYLATKSTPQSFTEATKTFD